MQAGIDNTYTLGRVQRLWAHFAEPPTQLPTCNECRHSMVHSVHTASIVYPSLSAASQRAPPKTPTLAGCSHSSQVQPHPPRAEETEIRATPHAKRTWKRYRSQR